MRKVKAQSPVEVFTPGLQETPEDLIQDLITAAQGMSGTKIIDGIIAEEYNQELAGPSGMEVYDKMRRSDAQVSAVLMAMELPIRSGYWFIDPARDEDDEVSSKDQEIADFIDKAIFSKMKDGWDNKLREILTMLAFGFSVFEKTYTSDGKYVYLDKLAFRKQQTINRWVTKDGKAGVVQMLSTPNANGEYEVSIPGSKLVLFTFRKEGDNYQGISVLRSAYKNYYMKDRLYRFDAVKHERQGVGIPVIYLPKNATKEQKALAKLIVKNIRATEQTGVVMPGSKDDGWLFEFANLNAGTGTDLWESIKHHNREIAKNVLAQFLELGDTQSGSKALGSDQSDLFIASLTATANGVCEVINEYVIKELVDLNFDGVENYPTLKVQRISKQDISKLADTITTLVGGGIIKTDESIEDYMREMLGLPARSTDEAIAEEEGMDPEETDPENPEGTQDDLVKELETMAQDDTDGEFADTLETILDFSEVACEFAIRHLSAEHKKAISEAIKGRGGQDLKDTAEKSSARARNTTAVIDKKRGEYDTQIAQVRGEVDSLRSSLAGIPKGRAGTAQRKAIAAKAKALIAKVKGIQTTKKGEIGSLGELRAKQLTTAREARKMIAERKRILREELGKIGAKEAIGKLQTQVDANRTNIANLRADMKNLPKDDPKRDAIMEVIKGLTVENAGLKTSQGSIRTSRDTISKQAQTVIDTKKKESGLYHEHGDHCEGGDELPSVFSDGFFQDMSKAFSNDRISTLIRQAKTEESRTVIRKLGFRFNEFEANAPRPLTFAEKKVNFTSLIAAMDSYTNLIEGKLEEITAKQKADILEQVKKAVDADDIKAVGQIKAKYTGDMARELENIMKDIFEIGKKAAASEMAVSVIATPQDLKAAIKVQAQAVVDKVTAELENGVKQAVTEVVQKNGGSVKNTTAVEATAAATANLDKAIEGAKATITSLGVTGTINMGRAFVFERFPEKVYAFQFSAILDGRTTDTCRSLDGRIVKPGSSEYYDYSPPRHYRCRSIWVEILQDEVFKPKIDGIPSSIPKNATMDTFKDLQAPIILANSPAVKVVQAELEERKKKLADLESLGQYPNRQEMHRKRISELEASLKGIKKEGDQQFYEGAKKALGQFGVEF